jgi:hypothetical protein
MAESWTKMTAAEVRPGDRVRLATGAELEVSRIEAPFLGRDSLVAFVEDTPARWFKQPLPATTELDVSRPRSRG